MLRLLILLLAFAALCYWCVTRHSPVIEQDVLSHAQATLLAKNISTVMPTIDGRNVLLTGQVDTEEQRRQLLDAMANTEGVHIVDHTVALTPKPFVHDIAPMVAAKPDISPEPETEQSPEPSNEELAVTETDPEPESVEVAELQPETEPVEPEPEPGLPLSELFLTITKKEEVVRLQGYLPDQTSKDMLFNQVTAEQQVYNSIETTTLDADWPDNWAQLSSTVLGHVLKLSTANASITPGLITLSGFASDHQLRDTTERLLRKSLPTSWTLDLNIDIPLSDESIACETEIQTLLDQETITFNLESWDINQASTELLDSIIDNIQTCAAATFLIEGHTDSLGNDRFNELLSERRARSVKDYLVAKGIVDSRIQIKGYGATRPIADNNTLEGRSQNRRIEFVVLGESQ